MFELGEVSEESSEPDAGVGEAMEEPTAVGPSEKPLRLTFR